MIIPKWGNVVMPIVPITAVLLETMKNINEVLARMARVYLAIGGDPSLQWETEDRGKIVINLEEKINDLLKKKVVGTESTRTLYTEINHYYCKCDENEPPYDLKISLEISYCAVLELDFMDKIKDKHIYNLLKRIISLLLNNRVIPPIHMAYVFDVLSELKELPDNPEEDNEYLEMKKEVEKFNENYVVVCKVSDNKRLERLEKIAKKIEHLLNADQKQWLKDVFSLLWLFQDRKIEKLFCAAFIAGDYYCDCLRAGALFFVTTTKCDITDVYYNMLDDDINSGVNFPNHTVSIKTDEDIKNINEIIKVLMLMTNVFEGGNVW